MSQNSQFSPLDDKDILTDSLSSEKHITDSYNTFANECSHPQMKSELMNILVDEHLIQHEVFSTLHKKGWYPTESAQPEKITELKQKFTSQ